MRCETALFARIPANCKSVPLKTAGVSTATDIGMAEEGWMDWAARSASVGMESDNEGNTVTVGMRETGDSNLGQASLIRGESCSNVLVLGFFAGNAMTLGSNNSTHAEILPFEPEAERERKFTLGGTALIAFG